MMQGDNYSTLFRRIAMSTLSGIPVSVVIATHNRLSNLKACIESLQGQTYPKELTELIIVDDGSSDGTPQYLNEISSNNPSLKIITQSHGWQSHARNEGIRASQGELVAITDDDCTLDQNWLLSMVTAIQDNQADAIGGYVHAPGESLVIQFLDYTCALNPTLLPEGKPKYVVTADAIFRRKALLDVDLFDTTFALSGGEDVDLSLRMLDKGMKLNFLPSAQVSHWYTSSMTDFLRRSYRYGYGSRKAFDKHLAWDHWIPKANIELQKICDGRMYIRSFAEVENLNLRLWFCLLYAIKHFCFLAGYIHLTGIAELYQLPFPGKYQTKNRSINENIAIPNAINNFTSILLQELSGLPASLQPDANSWNHELDLLAPHYQAAIESKNMRTWVRVVSKMLDWNYILSIAASISTTPVAPSIPNENLLPYTKSMWLQNHRHRDLEYQQKFIQTAEKLSNANMHTPLEIQQLCHIHSVDVNKFREWYGSTLDSQNNIKTMASWPFKSRPKRQYGGPRPIPDSYR